MRKTILMALIGSSLLLASCDKWIDEAETPHDKLAREQLEKVGLLARTTDKTLEDGALILGLKSQTAALLPSTMVALGAMVDEVSPTEKPNVLLYKELKNDNVSSNSGQTDGLWRNIHQLRASAQEVLDIARRLNTGEAVQTDAPVFAYARVMGELYLAFSNELLATCFSDDEGHVRINDQSVNLETLGNDAAEGWKRVLREAAQAGRDYPNYAALFGLQQRYAASLLVRHYMARGAYDEAKAYLAQVVQPGEWFGALYNENGGQSGLYTLLGKNGIDVQLDASLLESLQTEAEKKKLGNGLNKNKAHYWTTITEYAPLILFDQTDVALIKAELILRGLLEGDAKDEVNKVVAVYDDSSVLTAQPTLSQVAHLRHVFLFLRGTRISDYRRGMVETEAWKQRKHRWMPIPEIEYQ